MQLLIHYQLLVAQYGRGIKGSHVQVSLEELAQTLNCTLRNVRFIIKKMEQAGWIHWIPGRGRGNVSQLEFVESADELVMSEMQEQVHQGNLKAVMELVQLPGIGEEVKVYFSKWFSEYFGYKELVENEKKLDVLRFPITKGIVTLDPFEAMIVLDFHLVNQIFDTLVRFDKDRLSITPHLSYHWEAAEDFTNWTFYLRKGVRFHHGKELTARDVAYTLLRFRANALTAPAGNFASHIREIRTQGPYVVQFILRSPNHMLPNYLSTIPIVPEDLYRTNSDSLSANPIGTGPYQVKHFDEYSCQLEVFENYFLGRAHMDRIDIWKMPKEVITEEIMQGSMDMMVNPLNLRLLRDPNWRTESRMHVYCKFLSFNLNKPGPQGDVKFRQAMHHLIDRSGLAKTIENDGYYVPANTFVPKGKLSEIDEAYNLEKAKELLRQGEYSGEPLRLFTFGAKNMVEWIEQQCRRVGISIEIVHLPKAGPFRIEDILNADCLLYGVAVNEPVDLELMDLFLNPSVPIYAFLNQDMQSELDQEQIEILKEPLYEDRLRRILNVEKTIKESYQLLFLLYGSSQAVFHHAMRGVSINALGLVDFRNVWFQPSLDEGEIYDPELDNH